MKNTEKAGGTRFSTGKPGGWWYAPLHGLRLVAEVWQPGGEKYAPADWKSGQSFSTLIDCAMRHMLCVLHEGPWSRDEDVFDEHGGLVTRGTGAYHAASVVWNLLTLLTFMALKRYDLDDVSGWTGVTTAVKNENGFSLDNPPPSAEIPQEFTVDPFEAEEQVRPSAVEQLELDDHLCASTWRPDAGSYIGKCPGCRLCSGKGAG